MNSPLPKQVRDQIERARQISEQMTQEAAAAEAQTAADQAPEPQQPEVQAPQAPAAETPPTSSAPQQPAAPVPGDDDATYWRNNYMAMKGRFDQANATVADLQAKFAQLQAELDTLKAAKASAPAPAPLITDADTDRFGEPVVDLVQRGARQVVSAEMAAAIEAAKAPLVAEIESLKRQVTTVAATTAVSAEERFFAGLTAARPNWEAENTDRRWLQWLAQADAITGLQRQALLDDAITKRDLPRTLAIFEACFGSPAVAAPTTQAPVLSPAPRTVGSTVVPTQKDEPQGLTRADIAAFYQRVAAGGYRNDPAGKAAFEQKISEALRSGTVT